MRIYRIEMDVNVYQRFYLDEASVINLPMWKWDATPMADMWRPPAVYILHPKLKRGNFFGLAPGMVVADSVAVTAVGSFLEQSGELLPLPYKAETFHALNVTECIDSLDEDRTEWVYGKTTGAPIRIKQFAFRANRLTETPLFKIPETCRTEIYTCEGLRDPEDEFKYMVDTLGLTGLLFQEVWRDA